jgi:drug/metabolite transporter (DMT)-like permease
VAGCKQFDHPFVQAAGMFIGETLCLLSFKISLLFVARTSLHSDQEIPRPFSPLIFALPALCDCLGTSVMYLGLTMTYASVFQMLRGSVVVFTGILSVLVLHRKLKAFHWLGMALVCAGALVVGSSSLVSPQPSSDTSVPAIPAPSNPFLGNVLIVCAQVIVAVQMVIEEKIFSRNSQIHPLQAVGWEGIFGFFFVSFGLCAMFFIPYGSDMCDGNVCVENALHALSELSVSPYLCAAVVGNMLSVAFFNFFGISLTQSMSATHRMVFDSLRTFVIWVISLYLQVITSHPLMYVYTAAQVVGFTILLSCVCVCVCASVRVCVPVSVSVFVSACLCVSPVPVWLSVCISGNNSTRCK